MCLRSSIMLKLGAFLFVILLSAVTCKDIGKLPNCHENHVPGIALVSTLDGKLSALSSDGNLKWEIDTGNGPLLTSNIHTLELTNSGKWIRVIPSLSGTLYRFDGLTIDPIPVTADSLLKSSFKYSDDLVIAGGYDVHTYGISFRSGKIFYTCSSLKCANNTYNEDGADNLLLIERSTQTVRAVEAHSGHERWNFSVGHHNIKLPHITCSDPTIDLFDWNITAIIPDGLFLASKIHTKSNIHVNWQYHFSSPIVRIWKWSGFKLTEIDLFNNKQSYNPQLSPAVYIGMHKKQLYIYESKALQVKIHRQIVIKDTGSLVKIPWKPISASGVLTEEDSTALSVLYSSEYVNGQGYYLYTESDIKKKNSGLCENNLTIQLPFGQNNAKVFGFTLLDRWWKEIVIIVFTTVVLFNLLRRTFRHRDQNKQQKVVFVERHIEVPKSALIRNEPSVLENLLGQQYTFDSRYNNDFTTLRCLGKGGFGIVFEAKQKIDECHYAIKRIRLPAEKKKRETVMREVKALAKLEHNNIVRYFNSWVEKPPLDWLCKHDEQWISGGANEFSTDFTSQSTPNNRLSDVNIEIPSSNDCSINTIEHKNKSLSVDSFIAFESSICNGNSNKKSSSSKTSEELTDKTDSDLALCSSDGFIEFDKPTVHNSNSSQVFLYIQMQLCQTQSLKEWLIEQKIRDPSDILLIFKQIVLAVEYVHLQGLIHRDLKPSNIFFALDGQIKVGDFGLAKDMDDCYDNNISSFTPSRNHTKEVGTRLYMSPEQLNGNKYNYKVDIYSLGLIYFELLNYFCTDMERIHTLTKVKDNIYPDNFIDNYPDEYKLLTMMLCQLPHQRLTTFGIRARPPINCHDNYNKNYDFELPKTPKCSG